MEEHTCSALCSSLLLFSSSGKASSSIAALLHHSTHKTYSNLHAPWDINLAQCGLRAIVSRNKLQASFRWTCLSEAKSRPDPRKQICNEGLLHTLPALGLNMNISKSGGRQHASLTLKTCFWEHKSFSLPIACLGELCACLTERWYLWFLGREWQVVVLWGLIWSQKKVCQRKLWWWVASKTPATLLATFFSLLRCSLIFWIHFGTPFGHLHLYRPVKSQHSYYGRLQIVYASEHW